MENKNVYFYIDGANFQACLSEMKLGISDYCINFKKFAKNALFNLKECPDQQIVKINYYNAWLDKGVDKGLLDKQKTFFNRMEDDGIKVNLFDRSFENIASKEMISR